MLLLYSRYSSSWRLAPQYYIFLVSWLGKDSPVEVECSRYILLFFLFSCFSPINQFLLPRVDRLQYSIWRRGGTYARFSCKQGSSNDGCMGGGAGLRDYCLRSVQSVTHHFQFLEYMISLFLSPALEQHQYIYWSLSRMASGERPSCCSSLVWSIVCDCGRIESILSYSEGHVVVWHHHQAVEKGIVSCHNFECTQATCEGTNQFTVLLYFYFATNICNQAKMAQNFGNILELIIVVIWLRKYFSSLCQWVV